MNLITVVYVIITVGVVQQETAMLTDVPACDPRALGDRNAVIKWCIPVTEVPQNETVDVECAPGYYLNSRKTVTCRKGGWDFVQCIPGCPPPGKRNNAKLDVENKFYEIGEKVSYICDKGYFSWMDYSVNYLNITCELDSTWSDKGVGYCLRGERITVSTVDFESFTTNYIKLDCDLEAVEKSWYRSEYYINPFERHHDVFSIISCGNLVVNLNYRKFTDLQGLYFCTGKIQNGVEIGRKAYNFIKSTACRQQPIVENSWIRDRKIIETENAFLHCLESCSDCSVKWFKDDEEIFSNVFHTTIHNIGLLLPNVTVEVEGRYTCQIYDSNDIFQYNVSHDLTVIPSPERNCGIGKFYPNKRTSHQPWLALLCDSGKPTFYCYGTLLNERWIITTASCALRVTGKTVIELGQIEKQTFRIDDVKIHPLYKNKYTSSYENDIALVQLRIFPKSVKLSDDILPACISPDDISNIRQCYGIAVLEGIVAGYMSWSRDGTRSIVDVEKMAVISEKMCRESNPQNFADDKFCARFSGNHDKANFVGNIGSPFLIYFNGRRYLQGIFSSSGRDIDFGDYDYFTSIHHHYKWIKNNVS